MRELGGHFSREIEWECEETHFPREIELKGKRDSKSGAHISREREGTHPKERFNIYEQSIHMLKEGYKTFIVGFTTRVRA